MIRSFNYFGSKSRIYNWVISFFPEHQLYVEPFGGSYIVGLNKSPCSVEVYNDIYQPAVEFFRAVQKGDYKAAESFRKGANTSFCGEGTRWYSGLSKQKQAAYRARSQKELNALRNRVKALHISSLPAIASIQQWDSPSTLLYVDPPYAIEARKSRDSRHKSGMPRRQYLHDYTEHDHRELAVVLHQVEGMVVLSGYDCPLYRELFYDWQRIDKVSYGRVESLWKNF